MKISMGPARPANLATNLAISKPRRNSQYFQQLTETSPNKATSQLANLASFHAKVKINFPVYSRGRNDSRRAIQAWPKASPPSLGGARRASTTSMPA
jgi:hypothetical protein